MSEEMDQTEETQEQPLQSRKVKKGFTLLSETIDLLERKSEEFGHNKSAIADAVLRFGLPVYGERGMADFTIMALSEIKAISITTVGPADEPAIPVPEPVATKRGRREKLRVPGMNTVPQLSQQVVDIEQQQKEMQRPHPQQGQDLYRPNLGATNYATEPGTHTPMAGNDRIATLEASMNMLMQQMLNMQTPQQQGPTAPVYQDPQQSPYPPVQPVPQPAPVFAASYPPGYTGPPGVAVPQPQPEQAMYPAPGSQGPPPQPHLQDPYAMNIGQVPGSQAVGQGGLTAQGLLSGNQAMSPNVGGGNINMDIANKALGPNWRNNVHRMEAANRRGQ